MTDAEATIMNLTHTSDPSEHAVSERQSAPQTEAASAVGINPAMALAEPYAFAFVQWPAVLAILQLPNEGVLFSVRIAAGIWLALALLAGYGRGRGAAFGNVMVFTCGLVAGAWWTYPSPWTLAWAPALLIGLYSAQRARLKRP